MAMLYGASVQDGGVRFVVPAPAAANCAVRLFDPQGRALETHAMEKKEGGVFELFLRGLARKARYHYVLDGEVAGDPFARFLPDGVDAPASVESLDYEWKSAALGGRREGLTIYELHVGTFTPEGTYRAAAARLPELADLGVTAIELMPLAAFAGARGWGYDGVRHFAPFAPYGTPEELAAFIDLAHERGLRVFLDVVYNHFGPAGNTLRRFAPAAFTTRVASPWGESPDFANPVMRAYVLDNVRYWLDEFRFDGLRLDATHTLHDDPRSHIIAEIARTAHALTPRRTIIVEDERNEPDLLREMEVDAVWADDFHHEVHVALTGEKDGYYSAYEGTAATLARAIERGWLYCGEVYPPSGKPRGRPAPGASASSFVYCLQNHDQVGNRAKGERLSQQVGIDGFAAASLLLLFLPMTPLLFMGQEWAAGTPFLYFTDHEGDLGRAITKGRRQEFASFAAFAGAHDEVPDPQAPETWNASKLDWNERTRADHGRILGLYRALLHLRREDVVLRESSRDRLHAFSRGALLVVDRWNGAERRRLIVNFTEAPAPLESLTQSYDLILSTSPLAPSSSVDRADAPSLEIPPRTAALFQAHAEEQLP